MTKRRFYNLCLFIIIGGLLSVIVALISNDGRRPVDSSMPGSIMALFQEWQSARSNVESRTKFIERAAVHAFRRSEPEWVGFMYLLQGELTRADMAALVTASAGFITGSHSPIAQQYFAGWYRNMPPGEPFHAPVLLAFLNMRERDQLILATMLIRDGRLSDETRLTLTVGLGWNAIYHGHTRPFRPESIELENILWLLKNGTDQHKQVLIDVIRRSWPESGDEVLLAAASKGQLWLFAPEKLSEPLRTSVTEWLKATRGLGANPPASRGDH